MGKLFKTLIFDGEISLSVIDSTDIVNEAIKFHNLTPVCAAALGRVLTVTAFMSSSLKHEDERLSVTIEGDGKGGQIVAAADGKMHVRGLIGNPSADLPLNLFRTSTVIFLTASSLREKVPRTEKKCSAL